MNYGLSMKAFKFRVVCYMGEMKRFFTGMHISRTKLYSDSVHLFLCNKYVCFLDRGFMWICYSSMTLLSFPCPFLPPSPPPTGEVGSVFRGGVSHASQSNSGALLDRPPPHFFFLFNSHAVCN